MDRHAIPVIDALSYDCLIWECLYISVQHKHHSTAELHFTVQIGLSVLYSDDNMYVNCFLLFMSSTLCLLIVLFLCCSLTDL